MPPYSKKERTLILDHFVSGLAFAVIIGHVGLSMAGINLTIFAHALLGCAAGCIGGLMACRKIRSERAERQL